jgi:NAD(P)H dehydrogenase (quinone)
MQAHIVLAHPEPKSFNAHLTVVAREALEGRGWGVTVSDLYALGFDPGERPEHYPDRLDPARFDTMAEQRHAADHSALPAEVRFEIERLDRADLVILQYPMWWFQPPAMLKGWFDRVFVYGEVYRSRQRFESGRFVGKRVLQSVTVATSAETYAYNGCSGDIELLLWPVNFTMAYVGFGVLRPFVGYGVEAELKPSDTSEIGARLKKLSEDYATRLGTIEAEPLIPFNTMSDWGEDGRIKASAPAYSPFIRHREKLALD